MDDDDASDDAIAHTARGTGQYAPLGARRHAGHATALHVGAQCKCCCHCSIPREPEGVEVID